LFAKQDTDHGFVIDGRAYEISLDQELILDHWERYPEWYRKQEVSIKSEDGSMHEAFIYTLDIDGERLSEYKRVMNDPEKVLANAKATRQRVMEKFPRIFSK
jgi:cytochrome oxidase Cu insertion factor (SCO1/SenC/PrrC family)